MKKIYFAFLAFVVINVGTAQSWQRLNPIPKGNSLFDIEFDANNNALPVPGNKATTDTATTFVLSNEEGKLIDRLLAAGYGNMDLYMTLVALQGSSGGVISNTFLDVLAACPAGSPIFTQELNNYAGISDGIAINTDGTVFTTSIKGRSYYGQPGYSTYPPNQSGVGREIFTYANSPEYYINAGYSVINGDTTHYYAFAIGWAKVQHTTFVLSNEEGKLIDQLLAAGYGNMSLYETLVYLQDASGGVISDEFLEVLGSCPAGSPIFTQVLNNYAGISDGIAINTDGTVFTTSIKGRNYYGQPGYSTYPSNYVGVEMFTYANSPEYYIPAGSDSSGGTYYAFAIAWNADNTSVNDLTKNDNIIIYPNPTTGILWFIPQNNEIINRVEAYDMKGKQVFCADNVKENHIDLSGLENGIYLLELETHNQKLTQKVIKI